MPHVHADEFLGLPPCPLGEADAVILPVPFERTVTYGTGTRHAPAAIIAASLQVETFDEEARVDFAQAPRVHTAPPVPDEGTLQDYLQVLSGSVGAMRDRFVLALGGEHTITYGAVCGLANVPPAAADPLPVTIVHVDAHADIIDELHGRRWSHGTIMRRLHERGCRIIQVGVRSLSRSEYDFMQAQPRVSTFYAHELAARWAELLGLLRSLEGDLYLSFDVDGLDPSVIPSTGTPQPDGLTWRQAMDVVQAVTGAPAARLIGADVVEFIPSAHEPGCDIIAARLVAKVLAFWHLGRAARMPRHSP
jgi:agmatinase